jgi:hypothetical protein
MDGRQGDKVRGRQGGQRDVRCILVVCCWIVAACVRVQVTRTPQATARPLAVALTDTPLPAPATQVPSPQPSSTFRPTLGPSPTALATTRSTLDAPRSTPRPTPSALLIPASGPRLYETTVTLMTYSYQQALEPSSSAGPDIWLDGALVPGERVGARVRCGQRDGGLAPFEPGRSRVSWRRDEYESQRAGQALAGRAGHGDMARERGARARV